VKNIIWAAITMIIGIFLLGAGLVSQGSAVTCGGKVMRQGDTCVSIGSGGGSRGYDEQKSKNERNGWIELGIGALMAVGGGVWLVSEIRGRRRAANTAPPTPV
jgi:hypothetical protein